ncbi:unnamed protein product [Schistosoma margrebowiei]|uniref:DUF5741 domain-containing protein n=1 Tax=Schistosoma margrebowiei TaxID=48269 RepID=A0AA84ZVN1_9TREM|nr:unnamed protein product [Schistosoma margrebowiei]
MNSDMSDHMARKPNKGSTFQIEHFHGPNNLNVMGRASSLEEALGDMRRENFRLRLLLYNYEKIYRQVNVPQDLESSRIFAVESENILLKEALNEKDTLLNFSSKTNDQLREQINVLKQKSDNIENDWRKKYDILHTEFQCAQEKVLALEMSILAKDTEFAKCKNEFQSSIAKLQAELAFSQHTNKRYRREIQMFRSEADDLRATLETVNKSHMSIDVKDLKPNDLHTSEQNLWNQSPQCNLKTPTTVSSLSPSFSTSTGHEDGVVRTPLKEFSSLHNQIPSEESYTKLTDRLNSARHLILELGNEKLRTDKLIASMKSTHEKEISALKDKCELIEAQLMKENQLNHEELSRKDTEIERLNNQINELIEKLDTSLSVREKLHFDLDHLTEQFVRTKRECADLQDQLNSLRISGQQKCIETVNVDNNNESNVMCTPHANCTTDNEATGSISRLRNLYDLIHDLMLRLNDVRFTQHSVVEMINRSLAAVDIEHSHLVSPLRKAISASGGLNRPSSNIIPLSVSRTNATYGGFNTLFENMSSSINNPVASSIYDHPTSESIVSTDLNETVAELRFGCPKSPVSTNLKCNSTEHSYLDITKPLSRDQAMNKAAIKNISLRRKLFGASQFKNQMKNFVESSSMCEDFKTSGQNVKKSEILFHSLTEDVHDVTFNRLTRKPINAGDLTMVEWEHKDIFERLLIAMSRLRDAIEECSDIGSEFWDLDVKKHLSVLLTSQMDSFHAHVNQPNDSIADDVGDSVDLNTKEADKIILKSADRSARFDGGQLPPFDPIGFLSQNEEASLSQLYGSAWRHPMGISTKLHDMKNLKILSEQSLNQSYIDTNGPLKESSIQLMNSSNNDDKSLCEARDLNNKIIALEAENSTLKKVITDLRDKMKVSEVLNQSDHISHEILHTEPDSSISMAPYVVFENPRTEELSKVLAQCQQKNYELREQYNRLRNVLSTTSNNEDVDIGNAELSNSVAVIHTIIKRLKTVVNSKSESANVIDLVDTVTSELLESRGSITKLEKYLSESVSLYDYQSLENEMDSLKKELHQVLEKINEYKIDVQYACDNLAPLLLFNESVALKVLVDNVIIKLNDQKNYSNSLTTELQAILHSVNYPIPETLDECIKIIKNDFSNYKATIDQLKADKINAINMIKELAPQNEDLCTLSDYIGWFIGIFNEKQCNFENLEQNYLVIQQSLCDTVRKYENLETTINELNDKLKISKSQVESLETELADTIKSHVPIEDYESIVTQINSAKEDLSKTQSKVTEYEQDYDFIKKLVGSTLMKQSVCLKRDIEELCANFNVYKKSLESNEATSKKFETHSTQTEREIAKWVIEQTSFINIPDTSLINDDIVGEEDIKMKNCFTKESGSDKVNVEPQNNIQINDVGKPTPNIRKYNELKFAAFEMKNKLISRTQKLESALKEVERLRGVIQQDKERASGALEELKDLRQKVLRKNQRIRDLENDVARLKACSTRLNVGSVQINDSSARLLSEPEQRRGCECQLESFDQVNADQSNGVHSSITASLLRCPATPRNDSTENILDQLADYTVSYDSVSMDNTHDPVSSINNEELAATFRNEGCNRCHNLNKLLPELHSTTVQLKKLITLNLSNEDSLLDVLNSVEQHGSLSSISCSQSLVDNQVKISHADNIGLIDQSGIMDNMKTFIESLHYAHVRLHYYATKIDHLRMSLVNQCGKCSLKSQKILSVNVDKSIDLLISIIRRLESLCNQNDLFDNHVIESILRDSRQLLDWIQCLGAESVNNACNLTRKEDDVNTCPLEVKSSLNSSEREKLKSQIKYYRRKYHQLLQNVDIVTKNLADTTDVISSTRTQLENVARLSPITDHSESKK